MILAGTALRAMIIRHEVYGIDVEKRGGKIQQGQPASDEFFTVLGVGEMERTLLSGFAESCEALGSWNFVQPAQLKYRLVHHDPLRGFVPSKL
ncbi:hypothetical protein StoSoilB3_15740 [Arthrobacter sp. StoSoilB3]|nr:hypothetical protein StoSoilB3_15740 [Arthrobacter sp. StoSoilB3]